MGKTILISSHILPELQDLCNKVGIIEQGELKYAGPWVDIVRKARVGTVVHVAVASNSGLAADLLRQDSRIATLEPKDDHMVVTLKEGLTDYSFLASTLVQGGYKLTLFREEEVNLETAFMRLTKGMVQ
ncbi:MAG: hypothetical protein QM770_18765 [Tepidisphaeraceae bacterium]